MKKFIICIVLCGCILFCVTGCGGNSSKKQNKEKEICSVNFDIGVDKQIMEEKLTCGTLIKEPTSPEKEGYNFIGWYYNDEKFDFSKPIMNKITLTAKWQIDSPTDETTDTPSNPSSSTPSNPSSSTPSSTPSNPSSSTPSNSPSSTPSKPPSDNSTDTPSNNNTNNKEESTQYVYHHDAELVKKCPYDESEPGRLPSGEDGCYKIVDATLSWGCDGHEANGKCYDYYDQISQVSYQCNEGYELYEHKELQFPTKYFCRSIDGKTKSYEAYARYPACREGYIQDPSAPEFCMKEKNYENIYTCPNGGWRGEFIGVKYFCILPNTLTKLIEEYECDYPYVKKDNKCYSVINK